MFDDIVNSATGLVFLGLFIWLLIKLVEIPKRLERLEKKFDELIACLKEGES